MSLGLQSLAEWDKPYNQADLTSLLIHLYLTSAEASKKKKSYYTQQNFCTPSHF